MDKQVEAARKAVAFALASFRNSNDLLDDGQIDSESYRAITHALCVVLKIAKHKSPWEIV